MSSHAVFFVDTVFIAGGFTAGSRPATWRANSLLTFQGFLFFICDIILLFMLSCMYVLISPRPAPTLASLSVDILASAECRLVVLICTGFMASDMCSMCSNIIYIIPLEKYLFKSLALFWKFDLSFSLHHFYNNMKNINFDKIQLMPFPFFVSCAEFLAQISQFCLG